jgi:hypothetical protein
MTNTIRVARFQYPGYFGCESFCEIRAYQQPGKPTVVVATELADNPGTSITNRAELVAWLVWCWLEKPEGGMLWVEHYRDRAFVGGQPMMREQFDFVTFETGPDGRYRKPVWKRVSKSEVEAVIGRPL